MNNQYEEDKNTTRIVVGIAIAFLVGGIIATALTGGPWIFIGILLFCMIVPLSLDA